MRTENEMFDLIINTAKKDSRMMRFFKKINKKSRAHMGNISRKLYKLHKKTYIWGK